MDTEMILVLDVGTWQVKAFLAVRESSGVRILEYGCVPSDGFEKGEVKDAAALSASIRQAVSCALNERPLPKSVFVGVNGLSLESVVALGSLSLQGGCVCREDLARLEQAAVFAALPKERTLVLALTGQCKVDGRVCSVWPLGRGAAVLEAEYVLFSAQASSFEVIRCAALDALGRAGAVFVPGIFATHELLRTRAQEVSYLLLDIGAGTADYVLYENKKLVKCGSLPLGGVYVTRDVMAATGLDAGRAERLKRYFAKLDPSMRGQGVVLACGDEVEPQRSVSYDFLYDVIDCRVRELMALLYDRLSVDLIDREIGRIYLTGGCANLYNFAAHLEALFKMEVSAPRFAMPQAYDGSETTSLYALARYAAIHPTEAEDADVPETEEATAETVLDKIKNLLRWR